MRRSLGHQVVVGQLWQSSDPRRLSAFRVTDAIIANNTVHVEAVYPPGGRPRRLHAAAFLVTGSKGYTLLRDVW